MTPPARPRTSDAVILLPGIMGSELVGTRGEIVWGMKLGLLAKQVVLGNVLSRLALPPDAGDDGIRPSRLFQWPVALPLLGSLEPYSRLEKRLADVTLRPEAVLPFPYDWRRSIETAGRLLADAAPAHLARWRARWETLPLVERRGLPEPKLTLVCHSMGGLVARWFAEVGGGRELVRQIVTLGTPFAGSVKAVRVLSDGRYLPLGIFARALRDAGRTFPGLHELVARYQCVPDGDGLRAITPSDLASVGADQDRAEAAFDVHRRLAAAVEAAGGARCAVRPLVGVAQATEQGVLFSAGEAMLQEEVDGIDHRGDGTVYRYAAAPKHAVPMYLPQRHGSLAKSEEGIAFVEAVLTDRALGEVQAPPGFGIHIPEVVSPGVPFDVEILDGLPGATCRLSNAETNAPVNVAAVRRGGRGLAATLQAPGAGLYRVSVACGGYSPVEDLVLCVSS